MSDPSTTKSRKKKSSKGNQTPLMKQYFEIKAKYPGAVLLFRVGDFYETFGEDAILVSKVLGIILTKRSNGAASHVELAGFPHHSLDTYLPRLVKAGMRVAVCDQLEDPKQAKGIVKRGVTELVTPGVTLNDKVLEAKKDNFLASIVLSSPKLAGCAFLEVSTGDFFCFSGDWKYVEKILATLAPAEIILPKRDIRNFKAFFGDQFYLSRQEDWVFQTQYTREKLLEQFNTNSLKGFGIESEVEGCIAAGAILHYLQDNQQHQLQHINKIYYFDDSEYVWLDQFTVRNLELVRPLHPDGTALVDVIDESLTPMGGRMLRRAVLLPLKNKSLIHQRHEVVEAFIKDGSQYTELKKALSKLGDLERLASKLATGKLNPKEACVLRNSMELLNPIKEILIAFDTEAIRKLNDRLKEAQELLQLMNTYLKEEISGSITDGNVINEGVSEELDELRAIKNNSRELLLAMQQREIENTGISSLKIGFNKVFGYYLEVTNAHKDKAPESWIRKQTLTNAERYITEELKEYEEKILTAEERIQSLELNLYHQFIRDLQQYIQLIQENARVLGEIDMLLSFASVAQKRNYTRPVVNTDDRIEIIKGRHPVIEAGMSVDNPYIPNDVYLNQDDQQIIIITGPNMAGKSALLRQTALVVLMAQMGSFVPADAATIGLVDKVFTRVGASDNISSGESTFMVEMNETAQIANNATPKSLVLLDEIGRGTSTYDGVSIAWAMVEYLHEQASCQAKTLFATHYHELNELENRLPRVKNYNVSVKEIDGKILFLRKLQKGGSEHSFGIHVAEMAGMPQVLVERAQQLLSHFEQNRVNDKHAASSVKFAKNNSLQLNMFELKDPDTLKIRKILEGVDIDRMTPVEALLKLQEIKRSLIKQIED